MIKSAAESVLNSNQNILEQTNTSILKDVELKENRSQYFKVDIV